MVKVDSAFAAQLRTGVQVKGLDTYDAEIPAEYADGFPILRVHGPH